ncbi:phosphatase PAP2 family protein [Myxococcota bacterium]|nr:phosphatase PAP2 family protein [Myxococcota bacterium]MBU1429430.1 phosphatase PAP2 family protein [Myxococcota bacterium]MBU1898798.1 phosphatase PAP2 family protein [Myxococcota bacterium]
MTPLLELERALFERINHARSPLFDQLGALLSSSTWPWLIAIALLLYALTRGDREGRRAALFIFIAVLAARLVSGGLADLIQRPAPKHAVVGTHFTETNGQHAVLKPRTQAAAATLTNATPRPSGPLDACPSPEAATLLAAIGVLSLFYFQWWLFVLPVLSGWAQLYTGDHRPGDVLIGWLIGAAVAAIARTAQTGMGRSRQDLKAYQAHLAQRR